MQKWNVKLQLQTMWCIWINTGWCLLDQDIAVALSWRLAGTLSSERKLHCINSTLKVSADYAFPFSETSKRRNYVNNGHISGSNSCFYLSPTLNGLLCLPCVLFAPDKVGRGQCQPTGRLMSSAIFTISRSINCRRE